MVPDFSFNLNSFLQDSYPKKLFDKEKRKSSGNSCGDKMFPKMSNHPNTWGESCPE